ncbi:MAG: sigma-54 dependent transcriptional regulator [Myxococcota bacterium]|jgi:two-component system NtrC family response regulator
MSELPETVPAENAVPFRVLVVDDEKLYAMAICRELKRNGLECDLAFTAREALERSGSGLYEAILLDHKLPDDDGIRIIPLLLSRQHGASLIVMTAYETIQNAIQAIRQGAEDYIVKETTTRPIIERTLEIRRRHHLRRQTAGWEEHRRDGLLGRSAPIERVRAQLERVAGCKDTTVLITGETGAGKEVAARHLHDLSCPGGPFISVDCVALPGTLAESLLFGHEKGAFTGAHQSTKGAFQEAGSGTILLDEIGDMDLGLQGKLLRVLESRRYQRVGSVAEHAVQARMVAATNRDLMEMVKQGRFRFDLYQRLSVFPVLLPPLRERTEDIIPLASHFLNFFSKRMQSFIEPLSSEVQERLLAYNYPGNVRELKNVLERAAIMTDSGKIELHHLPERIHSPRYELELDGGKSPEAKLDFITGIDTLETLEKKMITNAIKQARGVKSEAARLLGISRFQLLRRLEKYGMKPADGEE